MQWKRNFPDWSSQAGDMKTPWIRPCRKISKRYNFVSYPNRVRLRINIVIDESGSGFNESGFESDLGFNESDFGSTLRIE